MAIEKTPNVPPFVSYCAQLIPTVFDNSLSYYEALAALAKWMQDNLVDVINNNATVTEQYIRMTEELKAYVENYFDNLDVQEEINNKLDQMAEDGTLQEIITAYIQSNVAWTFDTVADMKSATNLVNGSYAQTLGYHAKDDGGAGIYYIDNTGTADEGSIVAIGDTLKAHLILTDKIIAEQFGAYGDDTHDDAVAIQKALDYGNDVDLPVYLLVNKTYKIGSTITALNSFVMDGKLHYTGTTLAVNIGDSDSRTTRKTFKLNVYSDSAVNTNNSVGVKLFNLYECNVDVYDVENFYKCIQLIGINSNGFVYNKINLVKVRNYYIGVELYNDVSGWVNENQFYGGRITNYSDEPYYQAGTAIKSTSGVSYENNNNVFYATCVEGNLIGFDLEYARLTKIYDARFEGVTTAVKFGDISTNNFIRGGYGNVTTVNMKRPNVALSTEEYIESFYSKCIFDSGDINKNAVHCSNGLRIAKLCSYVNNAFELRIRGTISEGSMVASSDCLCACLVNLDNDKTIYLKQNVSGAGNRLAVVSFDAEGNVINEAPTTNGGKSFTSYSSSSLGSTIYRTGSNSNENCLIKLPSTAVKALVGVINGSGITLSSLELYVGENNHSYVEYPLGNTVFPLSDRTPDTDGYAGQVCLSSNDTNNAWRFNGTSWTAF